MSQLGQDKWVLEHLEYKPNGTFVELGGHDGVRHSNTLLMEVVNGWTGLLVEANPELHAQALLNRPSARHINVAVGGEYGLESFFMGGSYGGLVRTMPDEWKVEHINRGNRVVKVPVVPLAHVLEVMPREIDYLSLDVEGAELEILQAFFKKPTHVFNCLTIEFRYDILLLDKLTDLLYSNDYRLDKVLDFDACFVRA